MSMGPGKWQDVGLNEDFAFFPPSRSVGGVGPTGAQTGSRLR